MNLLAIESATSHVGAGAMTSDGRLSSRSAATRRAQVETLHPMIAATLDEVRIAPRDLDGVVVDVGPGLFTGIRVGIAAAKGFAAALNIPIVGCSSTEILLRSIDGKTKRSVAVVDVRRGELAWQTRGGPSDHAIVLGTISELAEALIGMPDALVVGDGERAFRREIEEALGSSRDQIRFGSESNAAPDMGMICLIGREKFASGLGVSAGLLQPMYLRNPDARPNFASRPSEPPVGVETVVL